MQSNSLIIFIFGAIIMQAEFVKGKTYKCILKIEIQETFKMHRQRRKGSYLK